MSNEQDPTSETERIFFQVTLREDYVGSIENKIREHQNLLDYKHERRNYVFLHTTVPGDSFERAMITLIRLRAQLIDPPDYRWIHTAPYNNPPRLLTISLEQADIDCIDESLGYISQSLERSRNDPHLWPSDILRGVSDDVIKDQRGSDSQKPIFINHQQQVIQEIRDAMSLSGAVLPSANVSDST